MGHLSIHFSIASLLLPMICGGAFAQSDSLALTEVMFNPRNGGDNEFVELYNAGSRQVDLSGWTLADWNQADQIVDAGQGTVLQPGQFCVIFDQDYDLQTGLYFDRVPSSALVLRIDDAGIGNGLGNSGDVLHLIDPNADTVAAYLYTETNPAGISDEKIDPGGGDNPLNWGNGLIEDGTPGAPNSVSPKALDLSLSDRAMTFSPPFPTVADDVEIIVVVRNPGLSAVTFFRINLWHDLNRDGLFQAADLRDSLVVEETLPSGDSLLINFVIAGGLGPGLHTFQAGLDSQNWIDDCPENDFVLGSIRTHAATSLDSISLSEVMFNSPEGGSKNEYIEIRNSGSGTVDLAGWQLRIIFSTDYIRDAGFGTLLEGYRRAVIFPNAYNPSEGIYDVPPNALTLTLSDEAFELDGLYDDSDTWIHLVSPGGDTVSSYRYSANNEKGIPDERVSNTGGWENGTWPGGTPGSLNSVTPVEVDLAIDAASFFLDPVYPTGNDSLFYVLRIRNDGFMTAAGWLVEVLLLNADSLNTGAAMFPDTVFLLNRHGSALPAGETASFSASHPLAESDHGATLIARVRHPNDDKRYNDRSEITIRLGATQNGIVINEIMHAPGTGESEWIEIHNAGNDTANLQDWRIEDAGGSLIITTEYHALCPGGFLVIADASSFFNLHPDIPVDRVLVHSGLPALSASETLTLLQADHRVVDEVTYDESPASGTGVSLERRSPALPSDLPSNWRYSVSSAGSTPGTVNSLVTASGFAQHSVILNEIMYDPLEQEPEYVEIFNPGSTAINLLNWTIETDNDQGIVSTGDIWIEPGSFLILREGLPLNARFEPDLVHHLVPVSGLPGLINSGTSLIVRDLTGKLIDSIRYEQEWGVQQKGRSLERKLPQDPGTDPSNWASCVLPQGGTPGKQNSVYATTDLPRKITLSVDPNPFFPESGQTTRLTYRLPFAVANVTVRVYDHLGRLIRKLLNASPSGSYREIYWDGTDKNGIRARMGIYIVHLQAVGSDGKNHQARTTLVLGANL